MKYTILIDFISLKLGAAYNLFDSEELLEYSLLSIRNSVDYITVIYQNISNCGITTKTNLLQLLRNLQRKGLINDYHPYQPNLFIDRKDNEIAKRNAGLRYCSEKGMTHFISLDADECYIQEELEHAKKIIEEKDFDSSVCQMQTYYKEPIYCLSPPEDYYVPLIYKIDEREFNHTLTFPVQVDQTRKMRPKKIACFKRDKIQMHHFSYVRKDISIKLANSSANINFKHNTDSLIAYFNNWDSSKPALLAGKEKRYYNTRKVENIFNIAL